MRAANEEILARRWPDVLGWLRDAPEAEAGEVQGTPARALRVRGIQLASAYRPRAEAELQARLVPQGSRRATVYGLAQGELARVLLARPEIEELRVVVLDRGAARASLAAFDHDDWLGDPRVELLRPRDARLELPFAAAPACLRLAEDEALRLRDQIAIELAAPHAARKQRAARDELRARIEENRALLAEDGDVAELFGAERGATIRVAAPGPSLADHYAALRSGGAPLIALDAALKPLLEAGIVPRIVVTMDPHPEGMRRVFEVPLERCGGTTLVYFPVVPNEVLRRWPGPRLAARSDAPLDEGLRAELRCGTLFASGSVIHPAVDLAVRMGARRVELYGADFATPDGRSHVEGSAWQFDRSGDPGKPCVLDGRGRRVRSQPNLIAYLRDLERYIASQRGTTFVNAGRDGASIAGTVYPEASRAA